LRDSTVQQTEENMKSSMKVVLASSIYTLVCALSVSAFAAEGSFERTLQVSGPVNLDLNTGSGNVQVRPGGSNQVQITGHLKVTNWFGGDSEDKIQRLQANPPIQQSGNDIRIGHIDDPELRHNISISYEVTVPPDTRLHSHTGSGSQRIEGIRGPIEIDSGSGDLKLSSIGDTVRAGAGSGNIDVDGVKGNVHLKTGSGTVRATNVAGGFEGTTGSGNLILEQTAPGAVRADTGSGDVELRGVHGSLEARAGSGTIRADGEATGGWTVHTGSGTVQLTFPSHSSFDLTAHTGSGSISLDHPISVQGSISRKDVRGKVGNGGVPVEVQTGSGNIEIR
jgi:DUF4097 and DUF4098 domain-containing protein YvlB